jgi:hypothetical protein
MDLKDLLKLYSYLRNKYGPYHAHTRAMFVICRSEFGMQGEHACRLINSNIDVVSSYEQTLSTEQQAPANPTDEQAYVEQKVQESASVQQSVSEKPKRQGRPRRRQAIKSMDGTV